MLPCRQILELEGKDHDGAAGDATQLAQPALKRIPVVNRHTGHRRVERIVIKRQRLSAGRDHRGRVGGALGAHRRARLHS
jgi:hypothetical protein